MPLFSKASKTSTASSSKSKDSNANANLIELMDNLNTFITTSTKLVESIKATMAPEPEEPECACAQPPPAAPPCCPPEPKCPPPPPPKAVCCPPPRAPAPLAASTPCKPPRLPCEPPERDPPPCEVKSSPTECAPRPPCGPKPEKCARILKARRLMLEKLKKERSTRNSKLKESIAIIHENFADIQEQMRQLDRLYEDYETINTPDGEINPAALYREIMKPQPCPGPPPKIPVAKPIPKGCCGGSGQPGPGKTPPPTRSTSCVDGKTTMLEAVAVEENCCNQYC